MDAAAGPDHDPLVRLDITELKDWAEDARSAANPSQAAAAACSGPGPAPLKILEELISGGNHAKSKIIATPTPASRISLLSPFVASQGHGFS